MKLNSISGLTYKVADLDKAAKFYEDLGFRMGKGDESHRLCYVNWFWVKLVTDDAPATTETSSLHIKVDSISECYEELTAQGLTPGHEPEKQADGSQSFPLLDLDGHTLVFFEKK